MPQIVLTYDTPSGVDGAALAAGVWTKILFNNKVRDDFENCILNTNNTFTISLPIYPKVLRFSIFSSFVNTTAFLGTAKSRLRNLLATPILIDTSLNVRIFPVAEYQGNIKQDTSFQIEKSTTFQADVYAERACIFGRASPDGTAERYAILAVEIE